MGRSVVNRINDELASLTSTARVMDVMFDQKHDYLPRSESE